MFTRRTLFKLLAAVGVGSLWPTQGRPEEIRLATTASYSSVSVPQASSEILSTIRDSPSILPAIEQWENLLDDLDGVELIGSYGRLTPVGDGSSDYRGPCPFCRQGPDSLMVIRRDDSYFCTGCLVSGHALDCFMSMEGLSPAEAIRRLTGSLASWGFGGEATTAETTVQCA